VHGILRVMTSDEHGCVSEDNITMHWKDMKGKGALDDLVFLSSILRHRAQSHFGPSVSGQSFGFTCIVRIKHIFDSSLGGSIQRGFALKDLFAVANVFYLLGENLLEWICFLGLQKQIRCLVPPFSVSCRELNQLDFGLCPATVVTSTNLVTLQDG
jgi:hypothetical protein